MDPGTLICMISNSYSRFLWQQEYSNTAFSAHQDTTITKGTHKIYCLILELLKAHGSLARDQGAAASLPVCSPAGDS
jgi:hypothetical protein